MKNFTCPQGSIFSADAQDCTSLGWQMEDVINSAEDICKLIKGIDLYDDTTITTLFPLRRGLEYQEKFNAYVTSYNRDLEVTQSHMRVWRKGKSILEDIIEIYNMARRYVQVFDVMYNKTLTIAKEEHSKQMQFLEQEIQELKADFLKQQKGVPECELFCNRRLLAEKEERIIASAPMEHNLREMLVFIEYVRTHASEVVALATTPSDRIDQLYKNTAILNNTFSVYAAKAENDLDSLISDERRLNRDIQTTLLEIDRLEEQKVQLNAKQDDLIRESEENFERMKSLREEITKEEAVFQNVKSFMCTRTYVLWNIFSGNCDAIVEYEGMRNKAIPLRDELQQCSESETRINEEIEQLSPQITDINNQKKTLSDKIPPMEEEIKKIKYEKLTFEIFIQDLQNMEKGITSVLKDLKELLKMSRMAETVFQHIDTDLGKMMDHAKKATSESERNEAARRIIHYLDLHQLRIDQSSQKIVDVRECSKLN